MIVSLLIITSAFSMQVFAASNSNDVVLEGDDYAKDRIIVKLADNSYTTSMNTINSKSLDICCSEIRLLNPSEDGLSQVNGSYSASSVTDTQNNVFLVTLKEQGKDAVEDAISKLNKNPAVEIAEPDYYMECSVAPTQLPFLLLEVFKNI